jgi:aspartate racemase
MSNKSLPIIGVLGGMGPLATADFFMKLIRNMNAKSDQEHNRIIIDSNSQIPDRVSAILDGGIDPAPQLLKSAVMLENLGVSLIAVPCHSAYPFLEKIRSYLNVPILDMVSTVVEETRKLKLTKVGILASQGLHKLNLYQSLLESFSIETVELTKEENSNIIEQVRLRTKSGIIDDITYNLLDKAINILAERGAPKIALCCSELPLALKEPQEKVIDSNYLFARKVLEKVKN